jgi:hypothetical protein
MLQVIGLALIIAKLDGVMVNELDFRRLSLPVRCTMYISPFNVGSNSVDSTVELQSELL